MTPSRPKKKRHRAHSPPQSAPLKGGTTQTAVGTEVSGGGRYSDTVKGIRMTVLPTNYPAEVMEALSLFMGCISDLDWCCAVSTAGMNRQHPG